ncbi:hypothetical protein [Streptomyces sp. NPDC017260]|uniref:hypothetical protein n=1 Tax=unclassified Streptomyces TaxID=2593676 RepID=UPI00378FBB2E
MLIYSTPDADDEPGAQSRHTEPVCEPCGQGFVRRPYYRAKMVPLTVLEPLPKFMLAGGHRLIETGRAGEETCYDCRLTGTLTSFTTGRNGCRARPESLFLSIWQNQASNGSQAERATASAKHFFDYATRIGLPVGDWRPVTDDPGICATFTFRDLAYGLKYGLARHHISAEKLDNCGYGKPEEIGDPKNYKQVAFRFHHRVYESGSADFCTYTPGRQDVILYTPEGSIRAVIRITGPDEPEPRRLLHVTDAVCDAFGPIATTQYKTSIYE